jgi:hypothetical protein
MPCAPPRFLSLAHTPRHARVCRSVRRFKNPVRDVGGLLMSGHAVHFHGLDGGTASRHRPVAAARRRRPLPMPRVVLPSLTLVRKLAPSPTQSLAIKGLTSSVTRAAKPSSRHCRPSVLTVNSTLRPLATTTRATPTFLLHPQSFHACLLARPSRQFAGVELPAAAAAGLRRTPWPETPPTPNPPPIAPW